MRDRRRLRGHGRAGARALGSTYGFPPSPHTAHLFRLFGSRMLALSAWGRTARTDEETNRVLAVCAGMNLLDALTALASLSGTGRTTALRLAGTSGASAATILAIRSLHD